MNKTMLSLISCLICWALMSGCYNKSPKQQVVNVPTQLLAEGIKQPLNLHNQTPRLSWYSNISSQSHYQIQVATSEAKLTLGQADLWDSGQVTSQRSVNVKYRGAKLSANAQVFWRVRTWSEGEQSPNSWSQVSSWEMGLLSQKDWQAKWLQVASPEAFSKGDGVKQWMRFAADLENKALPPSKIVTQQRVLTQLENQATAGLFRYQFDVKNTKQVIKAKLHSTAGGYYEIFINGKQVDDRLMDPGQTDYDKRILYNTDRVEQLIHKGSNTIAVHLGSGWYNEGIAFSRWNNPDAKSGNQAGRSLSYGQPTFIAQLELIFEDGTTQLVTSNEEWISHSSPILKEGLFSGELFDANKVIPNWHQNDLADSSKWHPVNVLDNWPTETLEPQLLPAIKAVKEIKPVKILNPEDNIWVLDFGQNFTGVPTIDISALDLKPDQVLTLRYAEWVDIYGYISQKSGGGAPLLKQVDTYIASNESGSTWTPTFTWHGFRYVEIRGLNKKPAINAFTAHLLRSSVERVGNFNSSDPLLNRIHETALWGYESNLMAVPMDCPIRERAGWTGDAHAALITGNYNFDMANFWDKYLGDFKTAAFVAPAVVPGKRTHGDKYDWAAAEIIIAWEHYRHYGDLQLLELQYDSMLEYMDAGEEKLENHMLRIGYGDWCDPVVTPGTPRVNGRCSPQHTTPTVTSSALFAYSAKLMAKISTLLDKPEQATHFSNLFKEIRAQFNQEIFNPQSSDYGSQTANAMAIMFGIAPEESRPAVAKAINQDILTNWQGHAAVGALGQSYLYKALSDYGYADTAFNVFKAEGYPGYAYLFNEVNATTLWERKGFYDPKQDPDGTKAPGFSLNHPFHSGYDGWFYEGLGGIRPTENSVGYQDFVLAPQFVNNLDWVDVSYKSGYGVIKSNWKREGKQVSWNFTIPDNTTATVTVPGQATRVYRPGDYHLSFTI